MKDYRYVIRMAIPTSTGRYRLMARGTALLAPPNPAGQQSKETRGYRALTRPNLKGHKFAQVLHSSQVMSPLKSFNGRANDYPNL